MMRKFLISMTLISLIALATTNHSIAKEQAPEWTVGCYLDYTYAIHDPMTGGERYVTERIYLGNVPGGGFGLAICEAKARAYTEMRDSN